MNMNEFLNGFSVTVSRSDALFSKSAFFSLDFADWEISCTCFLSSRHYTASCVTSASVFCLFACVVCVECSLMFVV